MQEHAPEQTTKFLNSINKAALAECTAIEKKIKKQTAAQMQKAEAIASARCHKLINEEMAKIKVRANREIAVYAAEQKRRVYETRTAYQNKLFDRLRDSLQAFVETNAYADFLQNSAQQLAKQVSGAVRIYHKPGDTEHHASIKSAFSGEVTFVPDASICIGGIKAADPQNRLLLNDTLDARLEAEKEWFLSNSGLVLDNE